MNVNQAKKKICKYGDKCYRKNQDHLKNYDHEKQAESETVLDENTCPDTNSSSESDSQKIQFKKDDLKPQTKQVEPEEVEIKKIEILVEKFDLDEMKDIKKLVLQENQMQMPDDFYDLIEFCKVLNSEDPKNALKLIEIELTGIYDLALFGHKHNYKVYSRYFYDPPEFQTILSVKNSETLLHFGYFRDDPNEMPSFVGINEAKMDCKIYCKGDNIFSGINWYLDELIAGRNYKSNETLEDLRNFKQKMNDWCDERYRGNKTFSLQLKTPRTKAREKKTNCKLFHSAGLVVPVDSKGFGYRDVQESYEQQAKIFTNYCLKEDNDPVNKSKKAKADEKIQEIITLIQFANDETDYGMGLEFGLNMFSHGDVALNKFIKISSTNSYDLLNRNLYSDILREHLKNRKLKIEI